MRIMNLTFQIDTTAFPTAQSRHDLGARICDLLQRELQKQLHIHTFVMFDVTRTDKTGTRMDSEGPDDPE
jgi:hypothetical protein